MIRFNGPLARNQMAMLNDRQCHMKFEVAGDFWPNHFFPSTKSGYEFDSNAHQNSTNTF